MTSPDGWPIWPVLLVRILPGRPGGGPQAEMLRGEHIEIRTDRRYRPRTTGRLRARRRK